MTDDNAYAAAVERYNAAVEEERDAQTQYQRALQRARRELANLQSEMER